MCRNSSELGQNQAEQQLPAAGGEAEARLLPAPPRPPVWDADVQRGAQSLFFSEGGTIFGACAPMNFHPQDTYLCLAAVGLIKNKLLLCFLVCLCPAEMLQLQPALPQQISSRLNLDCDDNELSVKRTLEGKLMGVCLTCLLLLLLQFSLAFFVPVNTFCPL